MNFWRHFEREQLLAAHRGYRAIRAENTMSAFEACIGKCDFVELDVGFSRDGVVIIIHDDTLERTSDAKFKSNFTPPYSVVDYNYRELLELDFSSWFIEQDPFQTIQNKLVTKKKLESLPIQRIPTLQEALLFFKQHNIPVNVEIKDLIKTDFDDMATEHVISIIQELDMEDMILLSSFNHSYLSQAHKLAPTIASAALQEKAHHDNLIEYLKNLKVQCYHSEVSITDAELVSSLNSAGIIVNVFTANKPEDKIRLYGYGVKSIFTDFL